MLHKIYRNIIVCFLYVIAILNIAKAAQNLESFYFAPQALHLPKVAQNLDSVLLDSKFALESSAANSLTDSKTTLLESRLHADIESTAVIASLSNKAKQSIEKTNNIIDSEIDSRNNLDSLSLWVGAGLGVHFKNLESTALESSLDSFSPAFSVDCHDLLCKSRNDDILDSNIATLEKHGDNVSNSYTNYKLASIDTNTENKTTELLQQKSNLDSNPLRIIYGLDFAFYGDNLEGSYPYWDTRTLLQASIFPEIGLHFYGQNLRIGGYYIMNMGEKLPKVGGLSLYYDTTYKNFSGYFGIFPRKHWIGSYPNLYYRKDFLMQNPMTNGMALQYQSDEKDLQAEFIFDWYGGNLQKRIDEFLASAFIQKSFWNDNLFIGGSFLLYHTKNDEILNPYSTIKDVWLLDRLYYNAYVGTDLSKQFMPYMDSMRLSLGVLGSVERKRRHSSGLDPFSNRAGLELGLKAQYKGFGIDNSLYYGQGQMQYFNEYGESLYWGLPFYQARFYDRAEMYWEHKNEYCTARFSFIFHFTDTQIANTQMLTIILDTQKLLNKIATRH